MYEAHSNLPGAAASTAPAIGEEKLEPPFTRRHLLRLMALGSTALVGGGALVACGNTPSTTIDVTFITANWPTDAMPSEADQKKSAATKAYADTLDKWLKKNPGVKIKHSAFNIWDTPGLTAAITAGTAPTWYMGDILGGFDKLSTRTAFVKGLASDLTSLVQQANLEPQLSDWIVPAWRGWKVDEKYYCTPFGSGAGNGIFYRRDLFKEAGLEEPTPAWTWADFRRMAKVLTRGKVKGAALQFYGFGQNLGANWLASSPSYYAAMGILPSPKTSWHWRYDLLSLQKEYTEVTNNWRGMYFEDKTLTSQPANYGDEDVSKAFIRGDVAIMGNNTDYFTRSPDDPASVVQLLKRLNKPMDEVIGWISHPRGNHGSFGQTQSGLAVGAIEPRLQRNQAALAKAFDFLIYMSMGEGKIDQIVATYQATKDLQRVFTSVPPMTKNQERISGIPGTAEDAWGQKLVSAVRLAAQIPVIPNVAEYFQAEKGAGMPNSAFDDANSGLGYTQKEVPSLLTNLQNTLNQQAASLTSSISSEDFLAMAKKYYADLAKFWQAQAPDFYASEYQAWYEQKIVPALNG
jgi:ABC-type glycerol-3-phosphate transport system substrate-binding protein